MRFNWFTASLIVLLFAASASAQTHPCDATPVLTAQKGTKVGGCLSTKDSDGVAIDVFNVRIVIANVVSATVTNATPVSTTPNAASYLYFEFPLQVMVRGTRPVQWIQFTPEGDSPLSDAALWQVGGPPVKPNIKGIKSQ